SVLPPKTWVVGYFDEKTDGIMPRTKSGIPFELTYGASASPSTSMRAKTRSCSTSFFAAVATRVGSNCESATTVRTWRPRMPPAALTIPKTPRMASTSFSPRKPAAAEDERAASVVAAPVLVAAGSPAAAAPLAGAAWSLGATSVAAPDALARMAATSLSFSRVPQPPASVTTMTAVTARRPLECCMIVSSRRVLERCSGCRRNGSTSEVHLGQGPGGGQFGAPAGHRHLALVEADGVVAEVQGEVDVLLHDDDGHVAAEEAGEDFVERFDNERGQTERRLVEQQQLGLAHEGPPH